MSIHYTQPFPDPTQHWHTVYVRISYGNGYTFADYCKFFNECKSWCQENLNCNDWNTQQNSSIKFKNTEDAIMFKLKFGI